MRFILLLAAVCAFGSASVAHAEGMYISASMGASKLEDAKAYQTYYGQENIKYDTGYGWNVAMGTEIGMTRLEGELGYKYASMDSFTVSNGRTYSSSTDQYLVSGMINGYLDLKNSTKATPYVGAGVGLIYGVLDQAGYTIDDTKLGYQVIAGVGYEIDKHLTFDISYRYQAIGGEFDSGREYLEYGSNSMFAGLRYRF